MEQKLISIIVPLYLEETVVDELHRRLVDVLLKLSDRYRYEIIYVNDGSTDQTEYKLKAISHKNGFAKAIHLSRNFGHQVAITAGIDNARGDAVVVIDGDLQDPPEVIPRMIERWEEGFQVVYGIRKKRNGESWLKLTTASLFYRFIRKLSDTSIPLNAGDFRLLDRVVVEALKQIREESRYIRGLVTWVGFKQTGIYYERDSRFAGKSKFTLPKMIKFAMDALTGFSDRPLRMGTMGGLIITFVSVLLLVWILVGKLLHPNTSVQGWTSIAALILFIGGVQLFFTGIIGEYLSRIYRETKRRPLYFIARMDGKRSKE